MLLFTAHMLAVTISALVVTSPSHAVPPPRLVHTTSPLQAASQSHLWSFAGEITGGDDPLQQPAGVAVASDNVLYVIDTARDHIRIFDPDGTPLATWGEAGGDPGQFRFSLFQDLGAAGDLAVGPDGSIYVADTFNNRIQKLATDGTFLLAWGDGGSEPGHIFEPSGIGVDAEGRVYVAEASGVQVFDGHGQFLDSWDGVQADGAPLIQAADVAIDSVGVAWVTDRSLHRVVSVNADGTVRGAFGSIGKNTGELQNPLGVTVDATGNVYVAETGGDQVQIFDQDGTSVGILPDDTSSTTGLSDPTFIALGQDATLYVADTGHHRVLMFRDNAVGTPMP